MKINPFVVSKGRIMRSEYAAQLYDLIGKCQDCIGHRPHIVTDMPDFSHFDRLQMRVSDQTMPKNDMPADKNVTVIPIGKPNPASPQTRQIIELATAISSCRKCVLSEKTTFKVPGQGAIPAKIMVISFCEDDESEKTHYPMSGNVLDQFAKWLNAIKLSINDIYLTNLIKCNPHNMSMNKTYVENCMFHLDSEIRIINPAIIMTLGSTVVSSLCQRYVDINNYHGKILNYRGFRVYPTFHPTDVLSNPYLRKPVWDDLQRFRIIFDRILADPNCSLE